MSENSEENKSIPTAGNNVRFVYRKDKSCPTYHADGIFGGFTPHGQLYMDIFIERFPTPTSVECSMKDGGQLIESSRKSENGILRDVQCGIIMDIGAAMRIHQWLSEKLSHVKVVQSEVK
jgi:hypothetical protein